VHGVVEFLAYIVQIKKGEMFRYISIHRDSIYPYHAAQIAVSAI